MSSQTAASFRGWRWPWVSRRAFDIVVAQNRELQERNDRLVEAVSRPEANAPVIMPHEVTMAVEPAAGWFDFRRQQ